VFIFGSAAYVFWITMLLKKRKSIDYDLFDCQSVNQNKTYQMITAIQEIKLQNCEDRRRLEWEDVQADLFSIQLRSLKLQMQQSSGGILINEVKNVVITIITASCVISGDITLGMMLAVQYIIGQLNSPLEQFIDFIYSLQDMKISLERINDIHTVGNEEELTYTVEPDWDKKTISLTDVSFAYDPHALKDTISDVSFEIPKGKVTAIVGASGSGKTTLIKLMLGYYKVKSGAIYINGSNIGDISLKEWRKHCGVVMQDGYIFSESIKQNIAIAENRIDMNRVYSAAKIANIYDFIESLPLKFDTIIGNDGTGLSQGQRQRILIARAVYKNPDFIFLDEATNSLDAKNEKQIVEKLNDFYKGRTVVIVAHRLSTVKNADQIVVLADGKVQEIGTHEELISVRGAYYELVSNQLELGS
jgi:ATP-binding cassette subfamily B protein